MAQINFQGFEAYEKQLSRLDAGKAIRYTIYPAAGFLRDELKKSAPFRNGDLQESIINTKMVYKNSETYEQIVFSGYDRKGVPNALKARVIESGKHGVKKNPFVRKTVRRCAKKAEDMMAAALDKYFQNFMKNITKKE